MYTEQMTQGVVVAGTPLHPQTITSGSVNTGGIDTSIFRRAMFLVDAGTVSGTSPTLTGQIQESPDNVTWTNNPVIPTIQLTASNQVATAEIRAGQVSAGKRYVRLQLTVGGTTPSFVFCCLALGGEADHKPGNLFKDASVVQQQVVN